MCPVPTDRVPTAQGPLVGTPCTKTYVAFVEALQEWAELPADGPDAAYWGAAMTYEMSRGMWSGCEVRILTAESALYPVMIQMRAGASLWRDRTSELAGRAAELRQASMKAYRVRAMGSRPNMAKLERSARPDDVSEPPTGDGT